MKGAILRCCLRCLVAISCLTSVARSFLQPTPFGSKKCAWPILRPPSKRQPPLLAYHPKAANEEELVNENKTAEKTTTRRSSGPRINVEVRQHMHLLRERLDPPAASLEKQEEENLHKDAWKKTRAYLYRTSLPTRQVESVIDTLFRFGLDRDLTRHALQSSPRLLRKNAYTHLLPTLEFLRQFFGKDLFEQALWRNPDLLLTTGTGYNADELELVEFFLRHDLGMKDSEILRVKHIAPRLFETAMSKIIASTTYLLDLLQQGGIDDENERKRVLIKTVLSQPLILRLSVETNLKPRMEYLRDRLQLEPVDLCTLIKSCSAGILGLNVQDNLASKLDQLTSILSDPTELRQSLLRHPQILGLSTENLQAKIYYFHSIDRALAGRLLARSPSVFSLSQDNLESKIEFLAGIWGLSGHESNPIAADDEYTTHTTNDSAKGSADQHFASLLYEYPTILGLSLDGNLRPTVDFFNRTGYVSVDKNWKLQNPDQVGFLRGRYLATSLYNRLLPRWHFATSNLAKQSAEENQESKIPLQLLVSSSDAAFCDAVGVSTTDYESFKAEVLPRLKFSDQFAVWLKTGRPIKV